MVNAEIPLTDEVVALALLGTLKLFKLCFVYKCISQTSKLQVKVVYPSNSPFLPTVQAIMFSFDVLRNRPPQRLFAQARKPQAPLQPWEELDRSPISLSSMHIILASFALPKAEKYLEDLCYLLFDRVRANAGDPLDDAVTPADLIELRNESELNQAAFENALKASNVTEHQFDMILLHFMLDDEDEITVERPIDRREIEQFFHFVGYGPSTLSLIWAYFDYKSR